MIKVQCPRCKESFKAPDAYVGKTAQCPTCKHQVLIPVSSPARHHPLWAKLIVYGILFILVLWGYQSCSSSSTDDSKAPRERANREIDVIPHTVVDKEDKSYLGCKRMVNRVVLNVSGRPTRAEMKRVATRLWEQGNQGIDEFTVFMYLPEMDTESVAYAIAEFSPSGMSEFRVSTYLRPSENTPAENRRKRIFYESVSAQDTMGTQAGDKYIMDKYGLTYDQFTKISIEGVEKNWPMP